MRAREYLSMLKVFIVAGAAWLLIAEAQGLPDLPEALDAGWKGMKTCELLYENDTVRVGRCSFPPGVGHEKHFHYPHFGYVLEGGTMSITDDQGLTVARPTVAGDNWSTTEITVHEALNTGDTITSYLIVEPKSLHSN